MMLQTTNFNQANVCALYNKGVNARAIALDSLTSKYEKKIVNYLVVPNNCILSLSVSSMKWRQKHLSVHQLRLMRPILVKIGGMLMRILMEENYRIFNHFN